MLKYKVMFNQLIKLRGFPSFNSGQVIYYFVTIVLSLQPHLDTIIMYHLILVQKKNRINKKRKLVTSQKLKKNK